MKPSKRLARALRRGRSPKTERSRTASPYIDLVIPSAGAPTFRNGVTHTFGLFKASLKRPLAGVSLTISTALIFTVIKMALIYALGMLIWASATPDPATQKFINTGLWEILSWAMGPVTLAPWLAASVVASSGMRVRWRLVKEPLAEKGRLLQLIVLGLVALALVGLSIGLMRASLDALGQIPTAAWGAFLYLLFQATLMMAVAGIWQDGLPAHRALGRAIRAWRYAWKPLLGSGVGLLGVVLIALLAFLALVVLPMLSLGVPPPPVLALIGVFLLPVWLVLWAVWNLAIGGLALAYYDWGQGALPPPTL